MALRGCRSQREFGEDELPLGSPAPVTGPPIAQVLGWRYPPQQFRSIRAVRRSRRVRS